MRRTAMDATEHHFTGKERDPESGDDYFLARYFASLDGRFLTPDPSELFFADPTNPQRLNLYGYGLNNPLSNTDPTGLSCVILDDGTQGDDLDGNGCASAGINPSNDPRSDPNQFDPNRAQTVTVNGGGSNTPDSSGYSEVPTLISMVPYAQSFTNLPQLRAPQAQMLQVSAAPDNPKEAYCLQQAATGAGKDLTGLGLLDDIATAATSGDPSKITASDAVDLAKRGADAIAESAVTQAAVRKTLQGQGMRVPFKGVGRVASKAGKVAGAIGLGLTTISAYEAYQECMAQ